MPPFVGDCTLCGGPVVVDVDVDGGVEICTRCELAQPVPGLWSRGEIRERVRVVHGMALRGEL